MLKSAAPGSKESVASLGAGTWIFKQASQRVRYRWPQRTQWEMCLCHFPNDFHWPALNTTGIHGRSSHLSGVKGYPLMTHFLFSSVVTGRFSDFNGIQKFFSPGLKKKQTITTNNNETQSTQRIDGVDILFPFSRIYFCTGLPVHCCWIHPQLEMHHQLIMNDFWS